MEKEYVVIDFGGTSTKALHYSGTDIINRLCFDAGRVACSIDGIRQLLQEMRTRQDSLETVIITGGKSAAVLSSDGLPIVHVNEINAIGMGGLLAAEKRQALVVSMGTGTALVVANLQDSDAKGYHVQHVGGLALGGGTIAGLGYLLCGTRSFDQLDELALQGHSDKVDLQVADIVGGNIGIIPAELTASNFGRIGRNSDDFSKADVAAGLFTMVGQGISRLAIVLAGQHKRQSIVVIGQVIENSYMRQVFKSIEAIFGGQFVFVPDARYRVAEGAFAVARDSFA